MPGTVLFVALLAALTWLTLRNPHIALVAVLCMFGLEQLGQIYIPFLRTNGQVTNLYILALALVAVILGFYRGTVAVSLNSRNAPVLLLSILLYTFAFLSLLWTPVDGWVYWANHWPYLILYIVLAPLLIANIAALDSIQRTFIWIGGSLIAFLAFVADWGPRSLMIAGSDEDLGLPLAMAQMSGYLLITAAVHLRKNYLNIGWLVFVVLAALVVAIKTGSRGQVIFSIVSLLLVMPLIWKRFALRHALQLLFTGSLIILVGRYIFELTGSYASRWETSTLIADLEERWGMVMMLLSEWIRSPLSVLFGLGNSASFSPDIIGRYPHMVPLEVLGEEGVLGLALFVAIVLLSIRYAMRLSSLKVLSQDVKRVYAANFGCLVFTLLLSLKQGSLINSSMIFLFAVTGERYYHLVKSQIYAYQKETMHDALPNNVSSSPQTADAS